MNLNCEYCGHQFVKTRAYDNHCCLQMQKSYIFDTPLGSAAFFYYKEWLRLKNKNTNITGETFLQTKYFSSFINFIKFSNRMLLPDRSSFIKYVVQLNLLPIHWCSDEVYIEYIRNLDTHFTPLQQAQVTKKTVHELATIFDCDTGNIFMHLLPGDFLRLLKARKLSPWILLLSTKFRQYLMNKISREVHSIVTDTIINPSVWKHKFENNKSMVELMREEVQKLKL